MRTTFNTGFRNALADIQRATETLMKKQREVSSGRRVNAPSENPAATVGAISERAELATIDQYVRAADSVGSRLTVVDTVMSDVIHKITAGRAAGAAARSTVLTATQREATAGELEAIRDAIFSDLNTKFRGTFLFSGAASTTQPYTRVGAGPISAYQGSTTTTSVDVDRSTQIQVTFNGDELARGTDASDIFQAMDALITAVRAADATGIDTGLQALERAFDRAVQRQSRVGGSLRAIDDERTRLQALRLAGAQRLSGHEDANIVEAISGMTQAETAYRAALGAVGNTARMSLLDFIR